MKDRAAYQAAGAGQQSVESSGASQTPMAPVSPVSDAEKRAKKSAAGLTFPRFFTEAGVDPFDEIEWELRSAVIGSQGGEVVFEQRDVEIPKRGRSRPPTSSSRSISAARSGRPIVSGASSS